MTNVVEKHGLKARVTQDLITGRYDAILLGGEFDNCHGSGDTPDAAMMSLKLTVNVRRKRRKLHGS